MVTWPGVDPSIWFGVVRTQGVRWPWWSEEGDGDHGISRPQVGGGNTWRWLSWSADADVADPTSASDSASSSLSSMSSPWSLFSWDWITDRKGEAIGVRATSQLAALVSTSPSTPSSYSSSPLPWSLLSWDRITDWKRQAIGTGAVSQPALPALPACGHVSRREAGGGGSSGLTVSPKLRGVCAGCEFRDAGGGYDSTPFVPFLPYIPYTQKLPWHTGPRAVACRLFPKYGNFCGPNWSSGRDCGALRWDKGPVDWLDHCCLVHDIGYDSHSQVDLYKADCQLLVCLRSPPRGRDGKPFRLSLWGEFYRALCIRDAVPIKVIKTVSTIASGEGNVTTSARVRVANTPTGPRVFPCKVLAEAPPGFEDKPTTIGEATFVVTILPPQVLDVRP
ncbi:hypothetical protein CBR_g29725 [Chara braunii]|uniref:Phospholipase A2 domain-containing protein n=1 Tax=Chara braunii TaxID=69332 RepID=A0A388LBA2_CHABU|nr:hypothetical protein CBR_g29725 [Chara braunii]|eukprot:GBG79578.1 hypothetical protein CBR_g29725 [Chara braunii]